MKKIVLLILIICVVIITFSFYFKDYYKIEDRTEELNKFEYLEKQKAKAWLRVQGTNIDMPILYYYDVNDLQNPEYNIGWTYNNNLEKSLSKVNIYSHNMRNVSQQPLIANEKHERFEQLMSYIYTDFVKKNKYIQYTVNNKNRLYKIYAIYFQNDEEFNLSESDIPKAFKRKYIENSKKNSYFKFDVDVSENDNILTLITCTRFFGTADYNFVVEAREVRKNEKIKNYNVSEKASYEQIREKLEGGK